MVLFNIMTSQSPPPAIRFQCKAYGKSIKLNYEFGSIFLTKQLNGKWLFNDRNSFVVHSLLTANF